MKSIVIVLNEVIGAANRLKVAVFFVSSGLEL